MSKKTNELHCLGNGRICVYERGTDIDQIFGPPYSARSFFCSRLFTADSDEITAESQRLPHTDVWSHELFSCDRRIGSAKDYVASGDALFVREFILDEEIDFVLSLSEKVVVNNENRGLLKFPAGTEFYGRYQTDKDVFLKIRVSDGACLYTAPDEITVRLPKGESSVRFLAANKRDELWKLENRLGKTGYADIIKERLRDWEAFFARIKKNRTGKAEKGNAVLENLIDCTAVLLRTQQSIEGGVLAGNNYHLAYVRDQYGVSRAMLKLGMLEEAKAILDFYFGIFNKHGMIKNAQAMGVDGVFHIHENDEAEITGYLIIQAFNYYKRTGDEEILTKLMPMLVWAMETALGNLYKDMNSFNGDETYIAGGMIPREAVDEGSSEATMLTIKAGELLTGFAAGKKLIDNETLKSWTEKIRQAKESYNTNFIVGGRLVLNNPARREGYAYKNNRNGVCQQCIAYFGPIVKSADNYYRCPQCLAETRAVAYREKLYDLPAGILSHVYMDSGLLENSMVTDIIEQTANRYLTGGGDENADEKAVGYEPAFLLYAAVKTGSAAKDKLLQYSLELLDESGAWAEYYIKGMPVGTRYRPWESGIHFEAIYEYFNG